MKFGVAWFNIYLFSLALVLAAGCKTDQDRQQNKLATTFRLHLEGKPDGSQSTAVIDVAGIELYVNNTPFLDETSVTNAAVVDTRDGGYAIRVQYDRHGTLVLDAVTTENRGRRIAVFTQYGAGKVEHSRWLAAPYGSPITDGLLLFTPLTTREESEEIISGLNNVARKVHHKRAL